MGTYWCPFKGIATPGSNYGITELEMTGLVCNIPGFN